MNVQMSAIRFIIFLFAGYSACSAHAMPNNTNMRNIAAGIGGFTFTAAAAGAAALAAYGTSNAQLWQKVAVGAATSICIAICSTIYANRKEKEDDQELMKLIGRPLPGKAIVSWLEKQSAKTGPPCTFALCSTIVAIATTIASASSYLCATYPAFFYTKKS
jgi:hypothetical protein